MGKESVTVSAFDGRRNRGSESLAAEQWLEPIPGLLLFFLPPGHGPCCFHSWGCPTSSPCHLPGCMDTWSLRSFPSSSSALLESWRLHWNRVQTSWSAHLLSTLHSSPASQTALKRWELETCKLSPTQSLSQSQARPAGWELPQGGCSLL